MSINRVSVPNRFEMKIEIKSFWPAIIVLVTATILFCLPGNDFPEEDWFTKVFLDKWIHVGLFALIVSLWSLPLIQRLEEAARLRRLLVWVTLVFIFYGIAIEFIQGQFIPQRTFGVDDIIADTIGCGIGLIFARLQARNRRA